MQLGHQRGTGPSVHSRRAASPAVAQRLFHRGEFQTQVLYRRYAFCFWFVYVIARYTHSHSRHVRILLSRRCDHKTRVTYDVRPAHERKKKCGPTFQLPELPHRVDCPPAYSVGTHGDVHCPPVTPVMSHTTIRIPGLDRSYDTDGRKVGSLERERPSLGIIKARRGSGRESMVRRGIYALFSALSPSPTCGV